METWHGWHLLQDLCPVSTQHAHTDLLFSLLSFFLPFLSFLYQLLARATSTGSPPSISGMVRMVCVLCAGLRAWAGYQHRAWSG